MKHAIAALASVAMVACSDFEPQVGPQESIGVGAGVVDCGVASDVSAKVKASPPP